MKRVELPENKAALMQIAAMKEHFNQLRSDISAVRRRNKDTRICEIKSMNIMPKIKLAEATLGEDDINRALSIIHSLEAELEPLMHEVLYEDCEKAIRKISEYIEDKNQEKANEEYAELMKMYRYLPKELKTPIYNSCIELNKRISELSKKG
jgi:hypothetical protein